MTSENDLFPFILSSSLYTSSDIVMVLGVVYSVHENSISLRLA